MLFDTQPSGPYSPWPGKQTPETTKSVVYSGRRSMAKLGWQTQHFAKAAKTLIKHGVVTEPERQSRLDTCQGCEHFNPTRRTCGLCGCFMDAKAWIKTDTERLCPLDKWSV